METNNWTSFSTREQFLLPSSTSKLLNLYKLIHKTFFVLRIFEDGDRTRPYGIARDGDVTWDGDVTRDGDSRWWRHWSFRHGTVWYWSEITFIQFFSFHPVGFHMRLKYFQCYISQNFHRCKIEKFGLTFELSSTSATMVAPQPPLHSHEPCCPIAKQIFFPLFRFISHLTLAPIEFS